MVTVILRFTEDLRKDFGRRKKIHFWEWDSVKICIVRAWAQWGEIQHQIQKNRFWDWEELLRFREDECDSVKMTAIPWRCVRFWEDESLRLVFEKSLLFGIDRFGSDLELWSDSFLDWEELWFRFDVNWEIFLSEEWLSVWEIFLVNLGFVNIEFLGLSMKFCWIIILGCLWAKKKKRGGIF